MTEIHGLSAAARGAAAGELPAFLVGRWGLTGANMTQLEINKDKSGSILGSVWGKEPVRWSASGSRLIAEAERGSGSADYAINGSNELILSRVQGFILVAGNYALFASDEAKSADILVW